MYTENFKTDCKRILKIVFFLYDAATGHHFLVKRYL